MTYEEMKTADILSACGEASARELRAQGWQGGGEDYDIGVYFGDREAAEEKLGRPLTSHEIKMLEASIQTNLDASS